MWRLDSPPVEIAQQLPRDTLLDTLVFANVLGPVVPLSTTVDTSVAKIPKATTLRTAVWLVLLLPCLNEDG